jgi:hypothetical protein
MWMERLETARQRVEDAEHTRDLLVRQALEDGLGVRGVASALRIDKATVSRRYSRSEP